MIIKASTVVVTSVPFGHGNLQNLEAVKEALKKGTPVFVIDEVPIESRDFTKGQATALFEDLKSMGAVFVRNQDELLHMLNVSEEKLKMAKDVPLSIADHLKAGRSSQESRITDKSETGKEK
jgi:iron complex transport system ATP-binding protein